MFKMFVMSLLICCSLCVKSVFGKPLSTKCCDKVELFRRQCRNLLKEVYGLGTPKIDREALKQVRLKIQLLCEDFKKNIACHDSDIYLYHPDKPDGFLGKMKKAEDFYLTAEEFDHECSEIHRIIFQELGIRANSFKRAIEINEQQELLVLFDNQVKNFTFFVEQFDLGKRKVSMAKIYQERNKDFYLKRFIERIEQYWCAAVQTVENKAEEADDFFCFFDCSTD